MSLFTSKPVTCLHSVTGENGSNPNASKATLMNRQALPAVKVQTKSMKERDQPLLQESSAVSSRREMMHLTAVSLCCASFFFPTTAEARSGNANIKEKVTGKLEELKEKVPKPNLEELKEKVPKPNLEDLKDKAGLSKPNLEDLKNKAGQAKPNFEDLKNKAGQSKPNLEDLKDKVGQSTPNLEDLKDKAGQSKSKLEELKDKAGLSKPTNAIYGSKAKPIDGVAGTSPGGASQQTRNFLTG